MNYSYDGLLLKQRRESDSRLFCTAAPASEILKWAQVVNTADQPGAAQRMLSDTHVKRIRRYLEGSSKNTIPTTVTIALEGDFELGELGMSIPPETHQPWKSQLELRRLTIQVGSNKPGIVIDGQHRLQALKDYSVEEIPIFLSLILGATSLERALQFVVINNAAKRVPVDLVKAIVSELGRAERDEFYERLKSVGITLGRYSEALRFLDEDKGSPFQELLDWDTNRDGTKANAHELSGSPKLRRPV